MQLPSAMKSRPKIPRTPGQPDRSFEAVSQQDIAANSAIMPKGLKGGDRIVEEDKDVEEDGADEGAAEVKAL